MESKIRELLSKESRNKLERMEGVPGAKISWSNPLETYDVLAPSTEKEVALASLVRTAMECLPGEWDNIMALTKKCWGKALDAEVIVPSSSFPIYQTNVPHALNSLRAHINNSIEAWSRDDVKAAEELLALMEKAFTEVEYVLSLNLNVDGDNTKRRTWSNQVLRKDNSSRLSAWLSESGYNDSTFEGVPTQEQILPGLLMKWSQRAMEWQGGDIEDPAMEALYQRRSISPINLVELHFLEEEYNTEWAAALF